MGADVDVGLGCLYDKDESVGAGSVPVKRCEWCQHLVYIYSSPNAMPLSIALLTQHCLASWT